MVALASKLHTVGNRTEWTLDYSEWLQKGSFLLTVAVVSASATLTIDGVAVETDGHRAVFFTNGGAAGEKTTVTATVITSESETKIDTVTFTVVAP
jgi:uncharacterized Zn-binding protein involved in type VI secretion